MKQGKLCKQNAEDFLKKWKMMAEIPEMSNPWYRRGDCTLFEYPTWWTLGSKSETVQYIQGKSGFYQKYDKDYRFCA